MTHKTPLLAAAFCAALSVLLSQAAGQAIAWTKSVDEALEQAKTENKVVLLAINMQGERASDELVRDHYKDPVLGGLSRSIVSVFCSAYTGKPATAKTGLHSSANKDNEQVVRERFLKADADQWIVAPQHVLVGPDGKIISSVSHLLSKGELEWIIVDAIRKVDPGFKWTASGRYRAPEKLQRGQANGSEGDAPPPGQAQVRAALKNVDKLGGGRRGRNNFRKIAEDADIIIRSDRPEALRWGKTVLRLRWVGSRLIKSIGDKSPKAWWKAVVEHLASSNDGMRKAAVIATAQLGEPKSFGQLKTAFKKEKDPAIEGRMLRTMASVAPTNRQAISLIGRALSSHKSEFVRAHATVATGLLEDRVAITTGLSQALQDKNAIVRSVAAYVIAIRQDKEMLQHLQFSLDSEVEADVKKWMEAAVKAVKTGDTKAFRKFLQKTLDSKKAAREAGGEGRGSDDGDGKGGEDGEGREGRGRNRGRNRGRRGRNKKGGDGEKKGR